MVSIASPSVSRPAFGLAYAWSGFAAMWAFWVCFVVFLASPRQWLAFWPLPMVDHGKERERTLAIFKNHAARHH